MKIAYERPELIKCERLSSVVAGPSGPIGPKG